MVAVGVVASRGAAWGGQPRPDPEPEPPEVRYAPYEIVVFPHDPFYSPAIAERMREDGFLIIGRSAMSGMILATTAPVPGIEEILCRYMRLWPEVNAAERNIAGDALSRQPEVCPPLGSYTRDRCNESFATGQIRTPCDTTSLPLGHPNDPTFCDQWGLHNSGQSVVDLSRWTQPTTPPNAHCWEQVGVPGIDINLLDAWERTTGSPLVTVAVLDSGIEDCNPDFDPYRFLEPGLAYNCPGNDNSENLCCTGAGDPCNFLPATDNFGHGTFVASIIAATSNNGIGMTGIDQQCKLLAVRALGSSQMGSGQPAAEVTFGRVILAMEEIGDNPNYESVRVINCSFRLPYVDNLQEAALEAAVLTLASQNRFVVAGSGNGGPTGATVPQRMDRVFNVGGLDSRGKRFVHPHDSGVHSSYGPDLDFMAPGMAEIGLTCQMDECTANPPPSGCPYRMQACLFGYQQLDLTGTSFAAPKVCGAISLILAHAIFLEVVNPEDWTGLTFDDMYEILKAGCRDQVSWHCDGCEDVLDTVGHDDYYGRGLIDIDAPLQYLEDNF